MVGVNLASFKLLERSGGPSTYLYNLKSGLEKINADDILILSIDQGNSKQVENYKRKFTDFLKTYMINVSPISFTLFKKFNHEKLLKKKGVKFGNIIVDLVKNVDKIKFIHFHATHDVRSYLYVRKKFYSELAEIPIILTSHSPEAPHCEYLYYFENTLLKVLKNRRKSKYISDKFLSYYQKIDLLAFEGADYLMFPCEESLEPYFETWKEFEKILSHKKIFYVPTGVPKLKFSKDLDSIREIWNTIKCFSCKLCGKTYRS
jgi:glycosyltransferase involved in cell wall biosynthesis